MRKPQLLNQIEQERQHWEALLAEVGEARMTQPGVSGDWTFKDVVAHLNGWRQQTLTRLEAGLRDEPPGPPPWPAGLDEDKEDDLEQINAWIYEQHRNRSLADVLQESRQQFDQMALLAQTLAEVDLFDAQRFAWMAGEPLAAVCDSSFEHLHAEHEPTLRQWLQHLAAPAHR